MRALTIIDGKKFAAKLRASVAHRSAILKERHDLTPGLAVVLVGDNPASEVYVRNKVKQTEEVGFRSYKHALPNNTQEHELLYLIEKLNFDHNVDGILVQLPLPSHINAKFIIDSIDVNKDVDGFHAASVGRLWSGFDSLVPCTPLGCILMLKNILGDDFSGKNAVVIGRSNIVGKPMASLLIRENCTVTIAHSRTRDLPKLCRGADILVASVGQPQMVKGDWIKPGAVVIDVGINRVDAPERGPGKVKLIGDVDFAEAVAVAGAITPVPGGVGPMTIACLLFNTMTAACRRRNLPIPEDPGGPKI